MLLNRVKVKDVNKHSNHLKLLFVIGGDHTRTKAVVTSRVGALSAFTRRKETCLGCKAVLPEAGIPLCKHCAPDESRLYRQELARFTALEDRFCRLWTQCQRCQGSLHEEVLCTRSVVIFLQICGGL
jgi:DNA polymerase delta subunit 1